MWKSGCGRVTGGAGADSGRTEGAARRQQVRPVDGRARAVQRQQTHRFAIHTRVGCYSGRSVLVLRVVAGTEVQAQTQGGQEGRARGRRGASR